MRISDWSSDVCSSDLSFIEDVDRIDIEKSVSLLRRPLLVMHAPDDQVVSIDHASRLFISATHPKSFVSLDTADHLLPNRADSQYVAATIAANSAARRVGNECVSTGSYRCGADP